MLQLVPEVSIRCGFFLIREIFLGEKATLLLSSRLLANAGIIKMNIG